MKLLITGVCGFVGSQLALWFREHKPETAIVGIDNFSRPGSETNRLKLKSTGVSLHHADTRCPSDFENLPAVDWIIDAAANPSVLAGTDGQTSSRQLVEHNLYSTVNLLEHCRRFRCGLILLSTSRVYSISALRALPLAQTDSAYTWNEQSQMSVKGASKDGIDNDFSTTPPLSIYGTTKLASELLALEYGDAFSLPLWINRCGVMAGAGQFGTADQGIFSFWIHSYLHKRPLKYIGFDGAGAQVRDALHPHDLAELISRQLERAPNTGQNILNLGGSAKNAMSLAQLNRWCVERYGPHNIDSETKSRAFDVPWLVINNRSAKELFDWAPKRNLASILDEIADHAHGRPDWLDLSSPR